MPSKVLFKIEVRKIRPMDICAIIGEFFNSAELSFGVRIFRVFYVHCRFVLWIIGLTVAKARKHADCLRQ